MRWYLVVAMVLTLLLAAALPIMAHSVHAPTVDRSAEQLQDAIWAFEEALEAGDAAQIGAFFTENAMSYPPELLPLAGKQAIEAFYTDMLGEYEISRQFELVDVDIAGNQATRLGEWTQTMMPKDGGMPEVEFGRCMFGYEFDGVEWKVAWQIWHTYAPDDGAAPMLSHDGSPC